MIFKLGTQQTVFDTFQYFYLHGFGVLALGHISPFSILFKLIQKSWNPGFLLLQVAFSLHFFKNLDEALINNQNTFNFDINEIPNSFMIPYIVFI